MRTWHGSVGFLVAGLSFASVCPAQTIGVYFDPNATITAVDVPQNTMGRFYILALLGGGVAAGMTGAEFRVTGVPAEWFVAVTPNPHPNFLQIGQPLSNVGVNCAFPTCQTAPIITLYTVDFLATTAVSNLELRVRPRNPPANPNFPCPLMVRCDPPSFSLVCATGGVAYINPVVAVTPSSWSQVKAIYAH
jgi:hypothetical protein